MNDTKMNNRTVKIIFKDNTNTTFEIQDVWLGGMVDDIKHAMALKLPYVLSSDNLGFNNQQDYEDTLIMPTENIKYIRIIDKPSDSDERA